jgi:hypothetical protein
MDADDGLRASDRSRLVGLDGGPDAALVTKERLTHLQGAFDELSDVHTKVLVMRELEGMSYREIGQALDLTRPAVESALFRARRRLESEYEEIADGRRCTAMRATLARMVQGTHRGAEEHRLARHVKRCHSCRHRARVLGIEPQSALGTLRDKAAALFPLPWLFRRGGDGTGISGLLSTGASSAPLAERAAAIVAAAALAGAGGVALEGGALSRDRDAAGENRATVGSPARERGESQRGATGHATDGERGNTRQTSGRRGSGPAGDRAGGSGPAAATPDAGAGVDTGSTPGAPGASVPAEVGNEVPSVPDTGVRSDETSVNIELGIPDVNEVVPEAPTRALPDLELPSVQLPAPEDVTGALPNALPDGLSNPLR